MSDSGATGIGACVTTNGVDLVPGSGIIPGTVPGACPRTGLGPVVEAIPGLVPRSRLCESGVRTAGGGGGGGGGIIINSYGGPK